jgi:hypothetical protein
VNKANSFLSDLHYHNECNEDALNKNGIHMISAFFLEDVFAVYVAKCAIRLYGGTGLPQRK